jgi:hypothetical protein
MTDEEMKDLDKKSIINKKKHRKEPINYTKFSPDLEDEDAENPQFEAVCRKD